MCCSGLRDGHSGRKRESIRHSLLGFVYPHAKWGYPLPEFLPLAGGPRIPGVSGLMRLGKVTRVRRGPGATPEAVCGTLYFLGLQAVCPSFVLVKVGGGSTPGERDKASALSKGWPTLPITALSPSRVPWVEAGQSPSPQAPAPNPLGHLTRAGSQVGPCGCTCDTAAAGTGKGSSRAPQ